MRKLTITIATTVGLFFAFFAEGFVLAFVFIGLWSWTALFVVPFWFVLILVVAALILKATGEKP